MLRGEQGEIIIHSFAHGGAVYRLFHSEASLSKLVAGLPSELFLAVFADAMQDLMAGEQAYERLRQMAIDHTGGKAKPVNKALEKREKQHARRQGRRRQPRRAMMLAATVGLCCDGAPAHDAERADTVKPIDAALAAVKTDYRLLRGAGRKDGTGQP